MIKVKPSAILELATSDQGISSPQPRNTNPSLAMLAMLVMPTKEKGGVVRRNHT